MTAVVVVSIKFTNSVAVHVSPQGDCVHYLTTCAIVQRITVSSCTMAFETAMKGL